MAPRTISQIAGEFGLTQGAASDPFARSEEATLNVISKSLADLRSQITEEQAARGFGRSSFTEGIAAQREADVLAKTGVSFAQARTAEDLRQRDFERGIIGQAVTADIQTGQILPAQTAAERELITARAGAETGLIGARAGAEESLIGARGTEQRTTLAQQIAGEEQLATVKAEQARQTLAQQISGEQELVAQRAQEQRETLADQLAGREREIAVTGEQSRALETLRQTGQQAAITAQAEAAGEQARLTQAEQAEQALTLQSAASANRIQQIQEQGAQELARIDKQYDRIKEQLPEELKLKADEKIRVIKEKLNYELQQNIVDTSIQAISTYILSNLGGGGGSPIELPTELSNITDIA